MTSHVRGSAPALRNRLASRKAGLLVFIENPSTLTMGLQGEVDDASHLSAGLLEAIHQDLMRGLHDCPWVQVYLAAARGDAAGYTSQLQALSGFPILELKQSGPLAGWDEGLSILFNRLGHRRILCASGQVPDLYPGDLHRALTKLELYEMVIGREGEDRFWLIGMDGYHDLLRAAQVQPGDFLHPILHAASQASLNISVLDTKHAFTRGENLRHLQPLAGRSQHPNLTRVLAAEGIHPVRSGVGVARTGTSPDDLVHFQSDDDLLGKSVKEGKTT
ncbi:MAG: hypothetical protein ACE5ID_05150 [Acidobacteriota bacterium]